jgi:hypothetical protein
MATANTAGHTKKVITNAVLFLGYCTVSVLSVVFGTFSFANGKPRETLPDHSSISLPRRRTIRWVSGA